MMTSEKKYSENFAAKDYDCHNDLRIVVMAMFMHYKYI